MSNNISSELVKKLRDITNAGIMDCRKALIQTDGDMDKAQEVLRQKGAEKAEKKKDRATNSGKIEAYIHMNRIGVIVELNCETDFVAKNEMFQTLAKDIAMQIAAQNPKFVSREEICEDAMKKQEEVIRQLVIDENAAKPKPEEITNKIVSGRLEKYLQSVCLLDQPFIKDQDKTISQVIKEVVGKIGENITVRRFTRYALGESDSTNE